MTAPPVSFELSMSTTYWSSQQNFFHDGDFNVFLEAVFLDLGAKSFCWEAFFC